MNHKLNKLYRWLRALLKSYLFSSFHILFQFTHYCYTLSAVYKSIHTLIHTSTHTFIRKSISRSFIYSKTHSISRLQVARKHAQFAYRTQLTRRTWAHAIYTQHAVYMSHVNALKQY